MIIQSFYILIFKGLNYKKIVTSILVTFLLLLSANAAYYHFYPNQMSVCPEELSVVNESTGAVAFIDKKSERGRSIISKMYGPYSSAIQQNNYLLSTPKAAEFTLPQFEESNTAYILREHPGLRYELWKKQSPDLILLGSSIFFCAFNRSVFYERHSAKRLLDFTTGNNTPYIANYFIKYADSIGCEFKPNTVVLYGLNRVEMLPDYKGRNSHDYVKEAISENEHVTFNNRLGGVLKMPELRYSVTSTIKDGYNRLFRGESVYRKEVPAKHLKNELVFEHYIRTIAAQNNTQRNFANDRVMQIVSLNNWLKQKGAKLYVLKLPQSLYNDIVLNTTDYSYYDRELERLASQGVVCIDASNLKEYNLTQLDYIWPNNIFDPEHLNVRGSKRFTEALMSNLLDSLLTQEDQH